MSEPRKQPERVRERVIRLAVEARRDPATRTGVLWTTGDRLGVNPETLGTRVTPAESPRVTGRAPRLIAGRLAEPSFHRPRLGTSLLRDIAPVPAVGMMLTTASEDP